MPDFADRRPEPDEPPLAAVLEALAASLIEVVGPEAADEVLFRVGRSLGAQGTAPPPNGPLRPYDAERIVTWAQQLGLAEIALDPEALESGSGVARLTGRVSQRGREEGQPSLCALTVGFLAGSTRRRTGTDLVSAELRCHATCPPGGCEVDLHAPRVQDAPRPTAGSARFYLDSIGGALSESEISLSELVESTHDAILLVDNDDVIRFWNRGAERMFGYPRADVVGRPIGFLVPPDLLEADELGQLAAALERDGYVLKHQTRRVRHDGVELDVSLTRTILRDGRRRPIGSTAIIRDVTEQRATERELRATRNLATIGELAAKVAHEIKNPLTGISGAVQVLRRGLPAGDPSVEVFDDILVEVGRLDETVGDLLRYARPTPPRLAATDLRTYVEDLVESLGFRDELGRHRIELDLPDELILPLDVKLFGPVITNLLLNASQAMTSPGAIRVRAHDDGTLVRIEVEDDGPGVSAEQAPDVFEPFFTTKSRGSGLGLAIARKNVELHGGSLVLDETCERGARFRIVLPAPPTIVGPVNGG